MRPKAAFRVLLDGRPMRTPAKATLIVPTRPLAEAIAVEWDSVPDKAEINAAHLRLTRLAATGIDRVRASACAGDRRHGEICRLGSALLPRRPRRTAW